MVLLGILVRRYLIALVWVKGSSMLPAFRHGDLVVVSRLLGRWGKLSRGQVVVCHYPGRTVDRHGWIRLLFIKRIIGCPGDRIAMENGQVMIQGEPLPEPYLDPALCSSWFQYQERTLGREEYFVMGDHRRSSNDSRRVGPLPRRMITGVVLFRLLSLPGFWRK